MDQTSENFLIPGQLIALFEGSSLEDIAIGIFIALILSATLGFLIRRFPGFVLPTMKGEDGQEAYVVSAVLGLLALLMGFTFSLALDRFEDRRMMVIAEANAIGTAYLRTQTLTEPVRSELSAVLAAYTDNRLALARKPGPDFEALLARNDVFLVKMWKLTLSAIEKDGASPITSAHMSAINDVIDLDTSRKNARTAKVPSAVYAVLMIYLMISAAILGYVLVGLWSRLAAAILFVLFTLSLVLIIDIDRPLLGELREMQGPMEQLRSFLEANPSASFRAD